MIYCTSPAVGWQIFNELLFCPVLCDDIFSEIVWMDTQNQSTTEAFCKNSILTHKRVHDIVLDPLVYWQGETVSLWVL